jgi:hypothetical protein
MNEQGTLKVTPITDKQPQPACRFSITALLSGFPITIEGEGKASDLKLIVERLKAIGATPPSLVNNGRSAESDQTDAPVCEFHGKMKKGNYGYFCPKKMGDGSYCKSKA